MTPVEALAINDEWVFALIHVDASLEFYEDGTKGTKDATKFFLLQKQPSGEWLIKRYVWNLK